MQQRMTLMYTQHINTHTTHPAGMRREKWRKIMNLKITLKSGKIVELKYVERISFPKVKTICFEFENGACQCYYTKAIESIEEV